jgi:hypothetical protein
MKSVRKIIREEIRKFVRESYENEEALYSYWNGFDRLKQELVNDFLYQNDENFSKEISWRVIPYAPLKRIWEDFVRTNNVRNIKGLETIERIAIRNTILIDIITNFSGHVDYEESDDYLEESLREFAKEQVECYYQKPDDLDQLEMDFETGGHRRKTPQQPCTVLPFISELIEDNYNPDNMDVEDLQGMIYDKVMEKFYHNYLANGYLTDYGLKPLRTLATELYAEQNPEKKLVLIDKILNVVHQTSDLAAWFIQGGSSSLNDLSGYHDEEGESIISGKYKMSDYR